MGSIAEFRSKKLENTLKVAKYSKFWTTYGLCEDDDMLELASLCMILVK